MMMNWFLLVAVVAYSSADSMEHGVDSKEDVDSVEHGFDSMDYDVDSIEHGVSPGSEGTTCKCGWANKEGGSRIVGGTFYGVNEYPFIVGIASFDEVVYTPFGGGSIITPNHVITAAHVTKNRDPRTTVVLMGTHDRSSLSSFSVVINVASIQQHAEFNATTLVNDISILTLESSINFNQVIGPVCLPLPGLDVSTPLVKVLGWGAEKFNGSMIMKPKELDTAVITPAKCSDAWDVSVSSSNPTQLCTLSKEEAACHGDSGGPVVWRDPKTNRYTLVGIVSYNDDCTDRKPSVNTRVTAFLPWIEKQIAATKPSNVCTKA